MKLELEDCFELQDTCGGVSAERCAVNTGGSAGGCGDHSKTRAIGKIGVRIEEVGVIQNVVSFHSNLKQASFEAGDLKSLQQREVRVEVAGAGELVSCLPAKSSWIGEVRTACGR